MKFKLVIIAIALITFSCRSKEEKLQRAEDKGSTAVSKKARFVEGAANALKNEGKEAVETASEGLGEVIKAVNTGFEKSFNDITVEADSAFAANFEMGQCDKKYSDSNGGKKVVMYLIANKNYNGKAILKAYNKSNIEVGRSSIDIVMSADDAAYFDFIFDERTPLLEAEDFVVNLK